MVDTQWQPIFKYVCMCILWNRPNYAMGKQLHMCNNSWQTCVPHKGFITA